MAYLTGGTAHAREWDPAAPPLPGGSTSTSNVSPLPVGGSAVSSIFRQLAGAGARATATAPDHVQQAANIPLPESVESAESAAHAAHAATFSVSAGSTLTTAHSGEVVQEAAS